MLTDEKARSTYDKYQQAKKAAQLRNDQLDIKRRKLKSELEARERNIGVRVDVQTPTFANVEQELKAEIDRLRKEGSRLLEEEQRLMREQIHQQSKLISQQPVAGQPTKVKLKWKAEKNDPENGGYNADNLKKFLGKYGDITELVLLPGKKGSALVEFKTKDAAEMAVSYEKGDLKNPLKLSWLPGQEPQKQAPSQPTPQATTITNNDFESLVLRNLRQAEERKRLIEQMAKEDAEES